MSKKITSIVATVLLVVIAVVLIMYTTIKNKKAEQRAALVSIPAPKVENFSFQKYGFNLVTLAKYQLECDPKRYTSPQESTATLGFQFFCNGKSGAPQMQLGWKETTLDNNAFNKQVASTLVRLHFGKDAKFTTGCDFTSIASVAAIANKNVKDVSFYCSVNMTGGKHFTLMYYVFEAGAIAGVSNFMVMNDVRTPGSLNRDVFLRAVEMLTVGTSSQTSKAVSFLMDVFGIGRAYAQDSGDTGNSSDTYGGPSGPEISYQCPGTWVYDFATGISVFECSPTTVPTCAANQTLQTSTIYRCSYIAMDYVMQGDMFNPVYRYAYTPWTTTPPNISVQPNMNMVDSTACQAGTYTDISLTQREFVAGTVQSETQSVCINPTVAAAPALSTTCNYSGASTTVTVSWTPATNATSYDTLRIADLTSAPVCVVSLFGMCFMWSQPTYTPTINPDGLSFTYPVTAGYNYRAAVSSQPGSSAGSVDFSCAATPTVNLFFTQ